MGDIYKMSFMRDIAICWRCANLYRASRFEKYGFSCYQYTYILSVCDNPGIAQDKLAKTIYVHKSNAARQLAALEEKGFVTRAPDPDDKRILRVYPTEKAFDAVPIIKEVLSDYNSLLLEGLPEEEIALLESTMQLLADKSRKIAEQLECTERDCGDRRE